MLRTLRIARFRGIRSAEVTFDRTTVLIGENDCGMSSVLEALGVALSSENGDRPRLQANHFHLGGEPGPLTIELTFAESRSGAWNRPELKALQSILGRRISKPRTLTLEISSSPPAGDEIADPHWEIRSPGGRASKDDVVALAALRRLNTLIWLRHGTIARETMTGPGPTAVLRAYDEFQRGAVAGESAAIESEFATAKRLLGEWVPGTRQRAPELRTTVAEILNRSDRHEVVTSTNGKGVITTGSPAQRLGAYVTSTALLDALSRLSEPGTRPIVLVEEPEAHLHPMTLATVWGLLELFTTQKIVTTHSGELLAAAPLQSIRRMVRSERGDVRVWRTRRESLTADDLRKVGYHLRTRRAVACFARAWLLVEGETEFWVMPELARLCGYDFAQEGIACVEYAQCGLGPLIKFANSMGIASHVMTDGDRAGDVYAQTLHRLLRAADTSRLTQLSDLDIEHCFWRHGYAAVFERLAGNGMRDAKPSRVIRKAIDRSSKPAVAFELLAAVAARGSSGPPPPLRSAIETCVRIAREANAAGEFPQRLQIKQARGGTNRTPDAGRRSSRAKQGATP